MKILDAEETNQEGANKQEEANKEPSWTAGTAGSIEKRQRKKKNRINCLKKRKRKRKQKRKRKRKTLHTNRLQLFGVATIVCHWTSRVHRNRTPRGGQSTRRGRGGRSGRRGGLIE